MSQINYTFWELIGEASIEIPTIQRDYTYGRNSAAEIRKKLIQSVLNAIKDEESPKLHLDFVYGKLRGVENAKMLEKNKQSIDTLLASLKGYAENLHINVTYDSDVRSQVSANIISFIPLDGQQRLTTLFLIHWSVVTILDLKEERKILQRFIYKTRNSSKEFLVLLCSPKLKVDFASDVAISEQIEINELFFTSWKKDPTVNSMLTVLDEIQSQLLQNCQDAQMAWKNLRSNRKVSFDFFNLQDFELTDELYLKMNARGKKLSNFENFKAWLIRNCAEKIRVEDWRKKLDLAWNDIFWVNKRKGKYTIDDEYLQFFKNLFLGDYLKTISEVDLSNNISFDNLRINEEFNPVSLFEETVLFEEKISSYVLLLDYIDSEQVKITLNPIYFDKTSKSVVEFLVRDNKALNWTHTTLYYALSRYILESGGRLEFFDQWVRVISNLIYNTPIESPKLYKEACESVDQLIKQFGTKNIYESLSEMDSSQIEFFLEKQRDEEVLKAKFIHADSSDQWGSSFILLEQHTYFHGQIGFMLEGLSSADFQQFRVKSNKIAALFSTEVMKDKNFLLFRALLSYGGEDCFFIKGRNISYPSNIRGTLRNRNENWRRFIQYHTDVIIKLIQSETYDENSPVVSLKKSVEADFEGTRFIKAVVKNKALLEYPVQRYIRKYDNAYYLLNSSRIYGYFVECYTYDWLTKNNYSRDAYQYVQGEDNLDYAGLKIEDDLITFNRRTEKFKINNHDQEYSSMEETIKSLSYEI